MKKNIGIVGNLPSHFTTSCNEVHSGGLCPKCFGTLLSSFDETTLDISLLEKPGSGECEYFVTAKLSSFGGEVHPRRLQERIYLTDHNGGWSIDRREGKSFKTSQAAMNLVRKLLADIPQGTVDMIATHRSEAFKTAARQLAFDRSRPAEVEYEEQAVA